MVENRIKLEHHTNVIFDHRFLLPLCKRIKLLFASIQIKHDYIYPGFNPKIKGTWKLKLLYIKEKAKYPTCINVCLKLIC